MDAVRKAVARFDWCAFYCKRNWWHWHSAWGCTRSPQQEDGNDYY